MRSLLIASAAFVLGCGQLAELDAPEDASADHPNAVDATDAYDVAVVDAAPKKDASVTPKDAASDAAPPPSGTALAYTPFPGLIALDATNVYWAVFAGASGTEISKCAKTGCNKTPTVLWSSQSFDVIGFGLAQNSVWFTAGTQYVASCATSGCNGTPTNLLSSLGTVFTAFAVDSSAVYFAGAGGSSVASCALGGCNQSPASVTSIAHTVYGFAQTDALLVWSDNEDSIVTCAKTGCATPTVLASGRVGATNVATDGAAAYWIELGQSDQKGGYTNGAIMTCSLSGCGNAPTAVVSYASWSGATTLAADATGVFWATKQTSTDILNRIFGCSGCNGAPKYYGYTASPSYGMAVDGANLYWSDMLGGSIMTAPK